MNEVKSKGDAIEFHSEEDSALGWNKKIMKLNKERIKHQIYKRYMFKKNAFFKKLKKKLKKTYNFGLLYSSK